MEKMGFIRISESAFKKYNGVICGIEFQEGLSTREVSQRDFTRLRSVMRAEHLVDQDAQQTTTVNIEETIKPVEKADTVENKMVFKYTREELEALADSQGIAGLREAASTHGIKGKTIQDIIEKMLTVKS